MSASTGQQGARVFVTQMPTRKDPITGAYAPTVNIGPAAEFGEIYVIMPANAAFYATADLVRQLRLTLDDYDFDRGDSIIGLGDPAIIATAAAILGKTRPAFRLLKWDRKVKKYISVEVKL